jgi:Holliday junction resolvase RusA-like endonuclease
MGQVPRKKSGAGVGEARRTGVREYALFVNGKPHPKERPRFNRHTGSVYTPEKTERAEQRIRDLWEAAGYPPFPAGTPLEVELIFNRDGTYVIVREIEQEKIELRGDIDNYLKTVMDGLNRVAWNDDKQVVQVKAAKA